MKKRHLIIACTVVALVLVVYAFVTQKQAKRNTDEQREESELQFAPGVEAVLQQKIQLVRELLAHPLVLRAVEASNATNSNISLQEIKRLDEAWRSAADHSDTVRPFETNEAARTLIEFQESHGEFSEIFITDRHGLNVAQTNKTSDFYQADEEWWQTAYANGRGTESHGPIEFDESAQTEAIALYVPVMHPETKTVVGVGKAIVSIVGIKLDL